MSPEHQSPTPRGLIARIGALADKPGDGNEERLRHRLLIFAGILMSGGGLLWGTISALYGLYYQAMVPFGYVVITGLNLAVLAGSKRFGVARFVQLAASLLLPFGFQWALGGFQPSGTVMIWSMVALVGSLAFAEVKTSVGWLAFYLALTVVSALLEGHLPVPEPLRSDFLRTLFWAMNLCVVSSVVFGLVLFFVAERKRALEALASSQQALVQSEKLAALGQLVAGVAHELNTPLGAIRASVSNVFGAVDHVVGELPALLGEASPEERDDLQALLAASGGTRTALTSREERAHRRRLRKELEGAAIDDAAEVAETLVSMAATGPIEPHLRLLRSPRAKQLLQAGYELAAMRRNSDNIQLAAERAAKIVFALKSYAHPGSREGGASEMKLSDNIDTVLTLYHNQIKQGVEVTRDYQDDGYVVARHDELNQVWTNLVHNALQAMSYRGEMTVRIEARGDDELRVAVIDSGGGIPADAVERIFDPFYTTKPQGEGTGLGLSICNEIVARHGGRFEVDSEPGRTEIAVIIPRRPPGEDTQ